jgi:hypothetical protein
MIEWVKSTGKCRSADFDRFESRMGALASFGPALRTFKAHPQNNPDRLTIMTRVSIPTARKGGALGAFRRAWTAPTTLIGHATAWLLGCRRPERIGGQATKAWLYRLPARRFKGWRGIAIGHVIIVEPEFLALNSRWLLAHELSHARQHDWLGPTYLPVHATLLFLSMVMFFFRPVAKFSRWHAYNPLERVLICVPIDVVADPPAPEDAPADDVLRAFGLTG